MICPNCGANNADSAVFCSNCGTNMQQAGASQNPYGMPNANPNPTPVPPQYSGMPGGVQERNIALCIILSIITCGIYTFYWLYTMTEDTNRLSGDPNATSGGVVIILSIITCGIYTWYWLYKRGEIIDQAKVRRGMPSGNSGILYLILAIVGLGIVSYALIQNELNTLAR